MCIFSGYFCTTAMNAPPELLPYCAPSSCVLPPYCALIVAPTGADDECEAPPSVFSLPDIFCSSSPRALLLQAPPSMGNAGAAQHDTPLFQYAMLLHFFIWLHELSHCCKCPHHFFATPHTMMLIAPLRRGYRWLVTCPCIQLLYHFCWTPAGRPLFPLIS
jgi:hypothetical protein